MSLYAKDTAVPIERSRAEIESILMRYGATAFAYAADAKKAVIQFQAKDRRIRFILPMPDLEQPEIKFHVRNGKPQEWRPRAAGQIASIFDQLSRQRWRALALAIKAKLEAVESGITSFEDEFMAHIVLPGGKTVSEMIAPSIETAYQTGKVGSLLSWDKGA